MGTYLRWGNTKAVQGCLCLGSVDHASSKGNCCLHCMDWFIEAWFRWCSVCGKHAQSILAGQRQPHMLLVWCCLASSVYPPVIMAHMRGLVFIQLHNVTITEHAHYMALMQMIAGYALCKWVRQMMTTAHVHCSMIALKIFLEVAWFWSMSHSSDFWNCLLKFHLHL